MNAGSGEITSTFESTPGGVLTVEAGAVTGDLELLTRPAPDGSSVEAYVRYVGARGFDTVVGSPVRAVSASPDAGEHEAAHARILEALTTPGPREGGNESPVDLRS